MTINDKLKLIRSGELTAEQNIMGFISKIRKDNPQINAVLHLNEKAVDEAREIDNKIKKGKSGKLAGIGVIVKSNINVKGLICNCASKTLENYKGVYNATAISKLIKEDAIVIGMANMDEFACGSSGESSAFGVTRNPNAMDRITGGSSSGSTASVAAGFCDFALGTDTGGSIRNPASHCGVVGFKPSYGMVSRYGLIAMASSLDQIGPFAKNVEDIKIIFNVIKGQDDFDSTTVDFEQKNNRSDFENLKIGVPKEYFGEGIDKDIKENIEKTINKFVNLGFEIKEISLPYTEYALAVYYIIAPAEISANLSRYDGIKYGFSAKQKSLLDNYLKTRARGFGDEVRRRIMLGTYVLSAGYRDAYYNKAQKVRAMIVNDFKKVFSSQDCVDFVLTPTTPTTAFKIGEKKNPLAMYLSDIYTVPASLAGLPAISMPCGEVGKLPIGLQIIGPQLKDNSVLEIAQAFENME